MGRDVQRCTVLPVGSVQGQTSLVPLEHEHSVSMAELKDIIMFKLAGRAAEQLMDGGVNDMTTYSINNLKEAHKRAKELIVNYGLSEKVRLICLVLLKN